MVLMLSGPPGGSGGSGGTAGRHRPDWCAAGPWPRWSSRGSRTQRAFRMARAPGHPARCPMCGIPAPACLPCRVRRVVLPDRRSWSRSWCDTRLPLVRVGSLGPAVVPLDPGVVAVPRECPDDLIDDPLLVMVTVDAAVLIGDDEREFVSWLVRHHSPPA